MASLPVIRRVASVVRRRPRTVEDSRMTLTEHLYELRNRLAKALVAFTVATAVCFVFEPHLFDVLKAPYCDLPASKRLGGEQCSLYFFGVLDAFFIRLKISMIAGGLVSSPVWLYQLWAFVTPGLHRHERRWAASFVVSSVVLFALGGFFAYLTLSKGLQLLLGFGGGGLVSLLDVNRYLSYVVAMLLVFGVSFEFPLLVAMLNLSGVVSTDRLRRWRRPEIFLVFVFAAVITPSQDPFTLIALAVPMCLFYEVAVFVGRVHDRRVARRDTRESFPGLSDDEASPLDLREAPAGPEASPHRGGGPPPGPYADTAPYATSGSYAPPGHDRSAYTDHT
ncbi:MAG TPA: twin-arginine translocase subunit TatC [Frankiaceae bacterium]|nr:twin-arginine translocase subunit TatC [Frankiaceae bacterium]